jgi:hypothetical protein
MTKIAVKIPHVTATISTFESQVATVTANLACTGSDFQPIRP